LENSKHLCRIRFPYLRTEILAHDLATYNPVDFKVHPDPRWFTMVATIEFSTKDDLVAFILKYGNKYEQA
jgi:hypothetical protein